MVGGNLGNSPKYGLQTILLWDEPKIIVSCSIETLFHNYNVANVRRFEPVDLQLRYRLCYVQLKTIC